MPEISVRYIVGDTRDEVAKMPDASVDFIMTSPPFLALRSYLPPDHPDKHREIGSEPTPAAFLQTLLELTAEWRRVLAPHGSICVELGDTYSGSGGAGGDYNAGGLRDGQGRFDGSNSRRGKIVDHDSGRRTPGEAWPLAKSICGIPHLYHLSLAYGRNLLTGEPSPAGQWRVRNVVVWARPNPPVGCVDVETEALTPDGWRKIDDLADGDLIAAYDPKTDSCRFLPSKFVRWERDGEPMVVIDKRSTSQWLTDDHRCWTKTRKTAPHVQLARDLTNDSETLLCAPFDDVAGPAPVTVERAELLGWYIAEGSPHHHQARIVQSLTANPAKCDRIRSLLERDGADFRETTYQTTSGVYGGSIVATFTIKGELAEWLNIHHKRLPMSYVTTWPEAQALALFNGLIDGDGHRRAHRGVLFHQKSEPIADAVQVLAIRLGYRASKTFQPSLRLWQITMSMAPAVDRRWTKIRKWDGEGIRHESYTGIVWCPMVETSFWLARRDGKTFITGNSLGDKFRPATSYLTIATIARDRYFDLDAVRHPANPANKRPSVLKRTNIPGRTDQVMNPLGEDGQRIISNPGGAPPLDYWVIPAQPYSGSHYATYPSALCVKPILSMCPQRVCTVCGQPPRRITERTEEYAAARAEIGDFNDRRAGDGVSGSSAALKKAAGRDITPAENITVGWTECDCPGGDARWRNGVVFDPFAGSGTTLAVAIGHGRDAIGIDIDERNYALARERIGPLFFDLASDVPPPSGEPE